MREILIATGNPDKAREIEQILGVADNGTPLPVRWRRLTEFDPVEEPIEDGATFQANAELKARYYAGKIGLWTLADDSGLQVDALGGAPGVRSARYAGEQANYADNNALLVAQLSGVEDQKRTARYRCVAVLSDGPRILASAEGSVEGRIIDSPRGRGGFGYDPHFYVDDLGMTMAEMTADQKHAISHRGRAVRTLRAELARLLA
jgi:XTP/dITP diphosphohydrolase